MCTYTNAIVFIQHEERMRINNVFYFHFNVYFLLKYQQKQSDSIIQCLSEKRRNNNRAASENRGEQSRKWKAGKPEMNKININTAHTVHMHVYVYIYSSYMYRMFHIRLSTMLFFSFSCLWMTQLQIQTPRPTSVFAAVTLTSSARPGCWWLNQFSICYNPD